MKTNRLTELELEKEYDKVDDKYNNVSQLIEQLYKENTTTDPDYYAFLKRSKDPKFAPYLRGMRKQTVPYLLDEYDDPYKGGTGVRQGMKEFEEMYLQNGGRIDELEQEQEAAMFERVKDEPGLQEFSLAAPAANLRALSALLSTGASKLGAMIPQGAKEALAGLPSIMQRRGGTGQGFEGFNKRRGGTKSRVNQNLEGLISRFYAETRGGTDLGGASQYTIELLRASMPEIRAAAARTKQNPKEGLNRIIQLMDELE